MKNFISKYRMALIIGSLAVLASVSIYLFIVKGKSGINSTYSKSVDVGYAKYVSAYTAGVVSKQSKITVILAEPAAEFVEPNQKADASIFDISPEVKGMAQWVNANTIAFIPEQNLNPGEVYGVSFNLDKVAKVDESKFKKFDFSFSITNQYFEVNETGLIAQGNDKYDFEGSFLMADVADNAQVEKMLSVKGIDNVSIEWEHDENKIEHKFVIKNIPRKSESYKAYLSYDGKQIGVENTYNSEIEIPKLGDFRLLSIKAINGDEQYFSVRFSDELDARQNMEGLFKIGYYDEINYVIEGNELKVYLSYYNNESYEIEYFPGIGNSSGKKTTNKGSTSVSFNYLKPSVKMLGEGSIMPSTQGVLIPFEAINLQSVQIKILKIYENNVPQFFQTNQIDGNREMARVGRPVALRTVYLNKLGKLNLMQANEFTLNLTDYVTLEQGAIYQVTIGFGKNDVIFICDRNNKIDANTKPITDENEPGDIEKGFDETGGYYYDEDYDYDYDWRERNNPCSPSFYTSSRFPQRNVLYSDLGLIAKRGVKNDISVFVTDINTASPIRNVEIECYNFQQQLIAKGSTDGDGIANIESSKRIFLVIAKNGKQKGYLRVDEASSNSISNFDVKGTENYQGLKGLIYGERGVWRPGDSLFLSFILEDKLKTFPAFHPVTLELINPQGKIASRLVRTSSEKGIYAFKCKTNTEDPTGTWTAKVKAGGATFSKNLRIETVKPNRLKMELDFGKTRISALDKKLNGKLKVNWLHGSPGSSLAAEYDVYFTKGKPEFKGYDNYVFDNTGIKFESQDKNIFNGKTNAEGVASVPLDLELEGELPGALNAIFKGKAFEPGGDFSIDNFVLPYYPYTGYVGISPPKSEERGGILETDKSQELKIVSLSPDGKPLANRKIKLALYKLEWKWWWEVEEGSESNYESDSYLETTAEGEIMTQSNGKGIWNFKVGRDDWGRYLIKATDIESGHSTAQYVYIDWPYAQRSSRGGQSNATLLNVFTEKEKYAIGDKIKISFPGGGNAKALISIENGSKLIETYWTDASKERCEFSFEAKEGMSPNIYIHVTLIQPFKDRNKDIPLRIYGIASVGVEDPKTHLEPLITMPDALKPEQEVSIKVEEKNKRPMAFTIAVVDEGLLDITKYKLPDVWGHFNAKEALGVRTWDMYKDVFGGFTGQMERMLSIGGDEALNKKPADPNSQRFKPVVKFFGPFYSDGSAKTVSFKMPNYIGSVKTMVVASYQGAYGTAEKTTAVKQPMMALATLPRVLGINEEVVIPVNIFVTENKIRNVVTDIQVSGPVQLISSNNQTTVFEAKGSKMAYFKIKTLDKTGIAKIKIQSKSGEYVSTNDVSIEVRSANLPITSVMDMVIEPGKTWQNNIAPVGIAGTNGAILVVSNAPSINLAKRLQFLIQYPHGCVEQTTSAVFPQLYLADMVQLSAEEKTKIENNVNAGIKKLQSFQLPDGGFSYWAGGIQSDEWGTNYATHFLIEAKNKGFAVPQGLIEKFVGYQKRMATAWANPKTDFIQAYRLYTLSLAKLPDEGAMNRLRESKEISKNARYRLAAAYADAGRNEAANALLAMTDTPEQSSYSEAYTYGSPTRDLAMMLEAFIVTGDQKKALEAYKTIAEQLDNNAIWMSTQTTAYSLIAASKFIQKYMSKDSGGLAYELALNGGKITKTKSDLTVSQVEFTSPDKPTLLQLKNTSKSILYAKIVQTGIPLQGEEKDEQNNLEMSIKYKAMNGAELQPENMTQGTSFMAEVAITNKSALQESIQNLALTQIFPSGWEIVNNRLDDTQALFDKSDYDNLDIRDDRVYTYFSLKPNERKVFTVVLNASYEGKYYLPLLNCESMYNNTIYARKAGKWVNVVRPKVVN